MTCRSRLKIGEEEIVATAGEQEMAIGGEGYCKSMVTVKGVYSYRHSVRSHRERCGSDNAVLSATLCLSYDLLWCLCVAPSLPVSTASVIDSRHLHVLVYSALLCSPNFFANIDTSPTAPSTSIIPMSHLAHHQAGCGASHQCNLSAGFSAGRAWQAFAGFGCIGLDVEGAQQEEWRLYSQW
jgi:hypothetical protein